MDVAISGDAFFKIEVPGNDEPLYTRNGAFAVDAEKSGKYGRLSVTWP